MEADAVSHLRKLYHLTSYPSDKTTKNDDPTLAEAVDALKKGENVRLPGLLDERIEECGPNRNCYAAVKRERNASKPPLEEFLSRLLNLPT